MFIVDLECSADHRFEGWYDTASEYDEIRSTGELTCPLCGTGEVHQVLSTGAIKTGKNARPAAPPPPALATEGSPKMPLEVQKQLAKVLQHVRQTHEDVGERFTETALAIHQGKEEARPIRGETDEAGEKKLRDEGVPFLKLPVPDIEKN